ncbi:amidase domain-containing protein [Paenibacillus sp. FSL H8-0537]|uniref:amidase domain-containing protein n=1 Tax=Paenibacillus sp. FSL H8-0537 TaxID=2921399 RepID=UPI003100CFC5
MSLRSDKQMASRRAGKQERQPLLNLSASQKRLAQQHAQAGTTNGGAKQHKRQKPEPAAAEQPRMAAASMTSLMRSGDSPPLSGEEARGWKPAVHQYVSLYNQAETEQHAAAVDGFVADKEHCGRLRGRLNRLRERDLLRGVLPSRSETKAELVRVQESGAEASVLIRLHIKRQIEHRGMRYIEERKEVERLWLAAAGERWHIVRIEPIIAERRPRFELSFQDQQLAGEEEQQLEEEQFRLRSVPYLNYDLFAAFQPHTVRALYRRDLAAAYADRWWNEPNPAYEEFEVNCTNYISQSVFAGNAPMNYTGNRGSGWWYKGRNGGREWWSYSWSVSNALTNYLSTPRQSGLRARVVDSAEELQLGDVITYDWNGDNRFQHSTIVTAFDAAGMPLVNANTVPSRHRYWDYRDSYAWTEQTRYRFFHIEDQL